MKRRILLLCLLLMISLSISASFRFVQVTDSHAGRYEAGNRAVANIVKEIISLDPKPDFVIATGDFIETGLDWEYEKYKELIAPLEKHGIPIYHTLGNHESRWAARIKKDFRDNFGPEYLHFNYNGHHFFLLDTSFVPEAYGHLETEQFEWLSEELAKIGPNQPIWVFSHHPLGFSARFSDNDWEAVERLLPYNLILAMSGHGHSFRRWQIHGKEFFMCKAADQGAYTIVDVEPERAVVYYKQLGQKETFAFEVPISRKRREEVSFICQHPYTVRQGEPFPITVLPSTKVDGVQVKVGEEPWQDLAQEGNRWQKTVACKYAGRKTLWVRCLKGPEIYQEMLPLTVLPEVKESLPKVLWTYKTGGSIFSSPTGDSERIYVGSHDGSLYALKKDTGQLCWAYKTGGPVLSSPLLWEGAVYFASGDGHVYSLDSATGSLLWKREVGEPVISSPAISQGRLYIGGPVFLYCLSAETGEILWQYEEGDLIKVRPVVHEGKVYFTSWGRHATCLDAQTGELLWKREIDKSFYYSPATGNPLVHAGKLFITTPRNRVLALDLETGETVWQVENVKAGYCSAALWGDLLLLTALDGNIYALDSKTGAMKWQSKAGEGIYDARVAVDGRLGITNTCWGSLAAFDLETGELKWKEKLADAFIFSAPYADGGVVYVGSTNDHIYAVKHK